MLTSIVSSLTSPDDLINEVMAMGKRHVNYGAQSEYYNMVGQALV